ncbi:hypothetical protein HK405_011205 [Cladochytrium tenue]|nr:hypothetical protein HK405_011205 [Cladochytrium tenue]
MANVAAACLFLATKVEECGRKLNTFVVVCAQKAAKNDNLRIDDSTREFWRWRETIACYEELVLAAVCFDLHVEHPFAAILKICGEFRLSEKLTNVAWGFANDCLRHSWLPLLYRPDETALVCVFVAALFTGEDFAPTFDQACTLFSGRKVSPRSMFEAADMITTMYKDNPPTVQASAKSASSSSRRSGGVGTSSQPQPSVSTSPP